MTTEKMKKFWVLLGCTLLVALAVVPNAFGANPNPRVTFLLGGSYLLGERSFVVDGDPFISRFLNGAKVRVRGSVDLTQNWSLETDYSFGHNDQRITEESGGILVHRDFRLTVSQVHFNFVRFLTDSESRIRPFFTTGFGIVRFSPTDKARLLALSRDFIDDPTQLDSSTKRSFAVGGGFEARLDRWLGIRVEVKDYMSPIPRFGLNETPSGPGGVFFPVSGNVHNIETALGMVFYFFP